MFIRRKLNSVWSWGGTSIKGNVWTPHIRVVHKYRNCPEIAFSWINRYMVSIRFIDNTRGPESLKLFSKFGKLFGKICKFTNVPFPFGFSSKESLWFELKKKKQDWLYRWQDWWWGDSLDHQSIPTFVVPCQIQFIDWCDIPYELPNNYSVFTFLYLEKRNTMPVLIRRPNTPRNARYRQQM